MPNGPVPAVATSDVADLSQLQFWLCALLAVTIALVLSSVELLTRYRSRNLREIFRSRHYVFFAALNAASCFLVYLAIPHLSNLTVSAPFTAKLDNGLIRAIVAGLGYLVIARLSILDITAKDGTTYGVGFDGIYHALAEYLLDHHRRQMRKGIRDDFGALYLSGSNTETGAFKRAATMAKAGLSTPDEQRAFDDRLNLAESNFPSAANPDEYCFTVYQLIRDYTTGAIEARQRIEDQRRPNASAI
jgi:hypothetical protein